MEVKRSRLYELIRKRKVVVAIILGLLFLLLCLAITHNYFGIGDWDKSKLIHFAENLANTEEGGLSLQQWLLSKADFPEPWMDELMEIKKTVVGRIICYLDHAVPRLKIFLAIIAFIASCLWTFEKFRKRLIPIFGEGRAPFSWKINTDFISKFRDLKSWKPVVEYFDEKFIGWTNNKVEQLKGDVGEIVETEANQFLTNLASAFYQKTATVGLPKPEIEKILAEKFKSELSEGSLLFLIDRISSNDHFAQFWELACQEFANHQIPVNYYYYQNDPRFCFDKRTEECVTIMDLAERHPQAMLVIVADGHVLIQSDSYELKSWSTILEKWKSRFLLSTRNLNIWDQREELLKKLFHLLPAKFSSLRYLDDVPNREGSVEYPFEHYAHEQVIDYEEDVFNEHTLAKYFANSHRKVGDAESKEKPQPTLDWIQSCAIPRELDFQLSLELGKASFDRIEGSEFTPEVILSVFQLPWFRKGKIEEDVRVLIAKKFDEESAKAAEAIRESLQMKLPKWKQPEDSQAADTLSETEQINEWKIKDPEPDKYTRQRVKKELNRIYDQGIKPDGILQVTDGIHNRYSKYFSSGLRSFIFSHGYSGLGLSRLFRNILYSLLAGLMLLLVYLIIIWLSRPLVGKPDCPPCPPSVYHCVPITKIIGASQSCRKKITLTGTEAKPLLAHLTGVEDDCCLPVEIWGSNVDLMIGQDSVEWRSGDSVPELTELTHGQTLHILIKDQIDITLSDSAALTIFTPIFDTVKTTIVYLSGNRCENQWMGYDVRFSKALDICATIHDTVVLDTFRRDTGSVTSTGDTAIWVLVVGCPEPDSLIIEKLDKEVWFNYLCGSIVYRPSVDTLPCDTMVIESVRIIECNDVYLNINCLGDDLHKVLKTPPRLILNDQVILKGDRFINRVKLPKNLKKGSSLEFELASPHYFEGRQSKFSTTLDINQGEFQLEIFPVQDSILQISGDIIVLDSTQTGLERLQISDNSLKLWHCNYAGFGEIVDHTQGNFCYDIKKFSFCDSHILVEWKDSLYRSIRLRDYQELDRCRKVLLCADFQTIAIRLDEGPLEVSDYCKIVPGFPANN